MMDFPQVSEDIMMDFPQVSEDIMMDYKLDISFSASVIMFLSEKCWLNGEWRRGY